MSRLRRQPPLSESLVTRRDPATFGLMAFGIGVGITSGCPDIGDGRRIRAPFGFRAALSMTTAAITTNAAIGANCRGGRAGDGLVRPFL